VTLDLGGVYRLNIGRLPADPPDLPELEIQLAAGGVTHDFLDAFANAPTDAGHFIIAGNGRSLTFQPSDDLAQPATHPVRLIVEGAETQPYWIELP
jgi:hypothetical protein